MKIKILNYILIFALLSAGALHTVVASEPMVIPLTSENSSFARVDGHKNPETNYGSTEKGALQRTHWDGRGIASLLRLDELPAIKASDVASATLRIYVDSARLWGSSTTSPWMAKLIPMPNVGPSVKWAAETVTYSELDPEVQAMLSANNRDGNFGAEEIPLNPEEFTPGWFEVDITDMVKFWIENPMANNGVALVVADTHEVGYGYFTFYSPYYDFEDPERVPQIIIKKK